MAKEDNVIATESGAEETMQETSVDTVSESGTPAEDISEASDSVITEEGNNAGEESTEQKEEESEEPDELTEEEEQMLKELQRRVSRRGHKLTKASKEEKKEMFRSDHVVTETGELEVKTESTMLKEDMIELNASAQAGRILEGTIIGCRSTNPDSDTASTVAEVLYGNGTCTVLIPDFVLFQFDITKYRTKEYQQAIAKRVKEMIGANVKFVVKNFDQKTKTAYADRLKAMESEAYGNFIRATREGKPRVIPGMLVQARIVAVRKNALIVYALGSEAVIKKDEVSWFYISDLREEFHVNQMVIVKVLDVKAAEVEKYQKEKYTLVATKLSIKQTTPDPMLKWFDFFKVGGLYQATITGINEAGTGVFVTLQNRVVCMCGYPKFGSLPVLGEQRVVEVTEKMEENGKKLIYGVFARV